MASAWGAAWGNSWGAAWGTLNQDAQTAKSGYWRMFYYQLQEQALAERDKPKNEVKPEPVAKPVKVKRKKRVAPIVVEPDEPTEPLIAPLPPFKPLPERPNYALEAWKIGEESAIQLAEFIRQQTLVVSQKQVMLDEENDEDEELLLLLM